MEPIVVLLLLLLFVSTFGAFVGFIDMRLRNLLKAHQGRIDKLEKELDATQKLLEQHISEKTLQ